MNESNNDVLDPAHADDLPQIAGVTQDTPLPGQQTADEWKASDDGNIVTRGDKRYVREEALHAERERAKAASAALARIEPLVPELTEFLQQKANRNNANVDRVTRPSADSYTDDDDLRGFAIVRGYYKQDGVSPDLDRANAELNIMARIADRSAAKHVGPVQRDSVQSHADANFREALSRRYEDGEPVASEEYIKKVFGNVPAEQRNDPQVAQMLEVVAAGMEYLEQRKSGKIRSSRREPNFREGASGRSSLGSGDALDALDRAAARARGKTDEQWGKMTKQIGGGGMGQGTVLEDIN